MYSDLLQGSSSGPVVYLKRPLACVRAPITGLIFHNLLQKPVLFSGTLACVRNLLACFGALGLLQGPLTCFRGPLTCFRGS